MSNELKTKRKDRFSKIIMAGFVLLITCGISCAILWGINYALSFTLASITLIGFLLVAIPLFITRKEI